MIIMMTEIIREKKVLKEGDDMLCYGILAWYVGVSMSFLPLEVVMVSKVPPALGTRPGVNVNALKGG